MNRYLFLFLILLGMIACGRPPAKFATVAAGLQYVSEKDHGFVYDTTVANGIKVQVQLLPASLVQKKNDPGIQRYFSIQFSHDGHELLAQLPRDEYGAYVQLFSFNMDKYIFLRTDSGKEYSAGMVSYQPTYNMGKSNELLAVFNEDLSPYKNLRLVIKEFGLHLGQLEFSIDAEKLKYSPNIDQF
ncbi:MULTISPECIES: hypothetical protein [Sphingobacterium]|uniref:hypothetical protein n=1 Tax=Sphingobacterium TaxID=28453 RepID=UPI00257A20CB|nr:MULTISPECIES: hypothetical protein [Sphingobacterium]